MKQKGDKSNYTAQKMKFSIKFPQFPADWSHLLKKIYGKIMEKFLEKLWKTLFFCPVLALKIATI